MLSTERQRRAGIALIIAAAIAWSTALFSRDCFTAAQPAER
jgi:hypothetical protein